MALTVQNLRAVGTGVEPASLLPGQICFNITDKVLYVGDGSSFKTSFDGTQVAGVPGEGWYAMPMDFASLGDYYVANPLYYGDVPTDQQVLTWSTALNHPIWTSGGGGGGGNQVYVVTNAQVASASGATTSDKITAAIGVASPDEGDVTIVTGLPDDVYEGLYFFTTEWVKGAAYAYPSASEVIYDNTVTGLTPTVQGAIDDLDAGLTATTAIANTANSTANSALSIANAALPKAGGTMTGAIVSQNINVQSGYSVQFAGGVSGSVSAISDSISLTSSTTAASSTAVRTAYLLAQAALPYAGGTMTGTITFAAGQIFPVSGIQDATAAQKGVVQIGSNIQVAAGTISILDSTTSNKGVVQLNDTLTSTSILQALTARAGKDLQDQIDSLTLASNVTLAGSLDASSGLIDSVTTQGAALVPPLVAGASLINAVPANADYYVLVTTAGSYSPPGGGGPYPTEPGDWFLSNGTTWQYLGVGARPQSATYTTAGIVQLADTAVTYTGTSDTEAVTPNSLQDKVTDSVATTDSNLIASATAVKAAYDVGAAAIPCSTITAVGDIVVGGAGSAPTALPVGTDGQVLVANSACSSGLEWVSDTPGDVTSVTATSPVTADNTDPQNPVIGINAASTTQAGAVQLNDTVASTSTTEAATANAAKTAYDKGVAACTIAQAAIPCASFTGLGELLTGTGAGTFSALPVGADGQVLLADSLAPEGLAWGNACYVPDACFTAAGDIIVGTGAGTYVALPIGTSGQSLVVDLTCTATGGLKWGVALTGYTCSTVTGNTALGQGAGDSITTGLHNTAIGTCAGTAISAGDNNTVIGWCTGDGLTSGNNNTVVGALAFGNTGGSNNTIMGYCAGAVITIGNSNTLLGANAGDAIAGGNSIVGVGQGVLGAVVTAAGTVAIGATAGAALTSGANTTLVGFAAGDSITTGARNTVVGHTSGGAITTGTDNTILGATAGNLVTGSCNILIGSTAGDAITTGSSNTIIGDAAGSAALTGNLILAAGTAIKFQANNSGAWSPDGTNYGTIGQVLTSNGTVAAPTWNTLSLACVPCAAYTAVGDILVGTGAATYSALPLGTSGQVMVVDTACASGVKWVTATGLNLAGFTCSATPFNTALGSLAGAALTALSVANTAIGYGALDAETSGDFNVAVGHNALTAQNGASGNVAIGGNAGAQVTSGSNNTLIGCNTGDALTTGAANVAIGNGALGAGVSSSTSVAIGFNALAVTTASNNVAVGTSAGTNTSTGTFNSYFGGSSGQANTTGSNNVYLGYAAGCSATTGVSNTLVGSCAGRGIVGQDANVAIGFETLIGALAVGNGGHVAIGTCALRAVTTGLNNLAIGCNAGLLITTGGCNIAIGAGALDSVTTTANNIGIGFNALTTITSGSENLAVGTRSGCAVTTGACNTFVGYQAGCAVTTGNQNTMVGPYVGTAGLSNNVVLSDGASNIRFQANSSGAWSPDGTNYGTSGQILSSAGTGAVPTWTSSLPQVTAPAASTDAGVQGQIASDATYFYMYTGGRWQRIAWDTTIW